MRLYRYLYNGNIEIGVEKDNLLEKIHGYNNIVDLLNSGYRTSKDIEKVISKDRRSFDDITILSPIGKPVHDIICVGKNYVDHISEVGGDITKDFVPNYFGKRSVNILGSGEDIEAFFDIDNTVDYEVELGVIISKEGKNINRDNYLDYILGFSVFNDISSRGLQFYHNQWYRGKGMDNYSILGPCIVTVDEFDFPLSLNLTTKVNGEVRQNSNTDKMIFKIEDILTDLSSTMTLEAGDIIATGTPSGVGKGFNPPKYLKSGDRIELEIEKIGILKNKLI